MVSITPRHHAFYGDTQADAAEELAVWLREYHDAVVEKADFVMMRESQTSAIFVTTEKPVDFNLI